ncbi:hypothetical protein [Alphaentomopoxvirus acuprea]|uniref:Uncharacterized protein n=1 Tax=Alphaentomopoxvirus acuprea TaxID=62099 RepID=W6JPL9_9POXV|nr:hypothetical protein BA82_gp149 [Anomala cuprea entomopoxvirus]BAO49509.1 hypothetical protein [Anomala cuprea entomopoxvirus]
MFYLYNIYKFILLFEFINSVTNENTTKIKNYLKLYGRNVDNYQSNSIFWIGDWKIEIYINTNSYSIYIYHKNNRYSKTITGSNINVTTSYELIDELQKIGIVL